MPTLQELLGKKPSGPKFVNLKKVGEFIKGTVVEIDNEAPTFEYDNVNKKTGLQKFWVDGKPKGVAKDEAERAGLKPVNQVVITLKDAVGQWEGKEAGVTDYRVSVTGSKNEREVFTEALTETGSIDPGDTFGKKLIFRDGNDKRHEMKIIVAS